MNFGLERQRLGTDYLSGFTTAGMICAAAKLIKLGMLHSTLEHIISSCYLNVLTFANAWKGAGFSTTGWSSSNQFLFRRRENKKRTGGLGEDATSASIARAGGDLCQTFFLSFFFHVCSDQKPQRNPAVLGRTPEPRTETFPEPRPRPVFPRGRRAQRTYKRWNVHHISGPYSFSATCVFQLWSTIFPISGSALINIIVPHGSGYF